MLNTLKDFICRVKELDNVSDAYYVFEDECSDKLRSLIYCLAKHNDAEPFRSAMHYLGFTGY